MVSCFVCFVALICLILTYLKKMKLRKMLKKNEAKKDAVNGKIIRNYLKTNKINSVPNTLI